MSQLQVVQPMVPSLPIESMTPEMLNGFNNMFSDMSSGFSTSARRMKIGKSDCIITNGDAKQEFPFVATVTLGMAQYNHAVWYAKEYTGNNDNAAPDLVWIRKDENDFHQSLPVEFRQRVNRNGRMQWAFQIRRRMVVALVNFDMSGNITDIELDNPCVLDLSGMSLWGKTKQQGQFYKWSGIIDLCKRYSRNGVQVTPAHFVTLIAPDKSESVSGVATFRPMMDNSGNLSFLNGDLLKRVFEAAMDPSVKELLTVREINNYEPEAGTVQNTSSIATVPPVAQQASNVQPAQPVTIPPVAQPVQPAQPAADVQTQTLLQQASSVLDKPAPVTAQAQANVVSSALDSLRSQLNQ